ncbi:MAG: efflux RND transporter permease subunit [Microscillaceae bacterium]|jgi:cobalt-zinc-cadmium resistance protein CzcA|nr:efflux RND transporter permease subunit [Microscillaceae bacterium]
MIDKLIAFSIHNKLLIGIFTLALIVWGGISLTQIPIDAVPDITNNQVQLITKAPAFSAQEIEQFITAPLELALANLQNVEEIRSISRFGISVITVVFTDEMNLYLARQLVNEQIKNVDIPTEMGIPEMTPITTGLGEIYQYVIHPQKGFEKKYSATDLRTIQDWLVRRQLAGTPGIVEVNSFGGFVKQYEVAVNPEKLRAANLTILEVLQALETNNENTGGSYIEKNANAYFIRSEGMISQLADIEQIVIKNINDLPILIKDIAQVQFGSAMRYGAMTRNGQGEVVGGIVMMLKGANSAQVIANVKTKITEIQKNLPEGLVIEAFLDRTDLVNRAITTVTTNLVEGGLIVIFVLVVFLGNLRAGLVVASVIPLAMLFAIAMMNLFGVSANLMSLGAIDFGLVVDGAVIIVEAILHRLSPIPALPGGEGVFVPPPSEGARGRLSPSPLERVGEGLRGVNRVVYEATVQIRKSAAFGEIIILMVYLPILALVSVEGKMFRPMAQTVGFAILGALILSLTYVPMMSALVLKQQLSHRKNFSDYLMDFIQRQYNPIIRFALRKKIIVLSISLGLFLGSLLIFNRLGGEFIPQLDEGDFAVETRLMTGSSLSQTIETSTQAEKILLKFPEVKQVISKIGTSEIPTDPMPLEANDLMVVLKDKSEWTTTHDKEDLANQMRDSLAVLPGINFEFQQPIEMRFNELMTGIKSDIAVKIYGEDLNTLFAKANECAKHIRKIAGVGDLKVEQIVGLPQMLVKYDRRKIAQYGLNIKDLNSTLQTAFAGKVAGFVFEGEKRFALALRFDKQNRQDIENLKGVYVNLPNGKQVPMEEVAQIEYVNAPVQISRDDAKRRITIGLNVSGRDVESLVNEIKTVLAQKVSLPPGYYFKFGGQFENLEKAKARLTIAVPMALALIFSLLYFTFNSIKQTILIFTAIPLSAIGGVLALWLRGMPFSISAGVGFIALFGVAVLNGIVLIAYFNQLEKEGIKNVYRRVLLGTRVRLRPVVMTATVASLGFLPMAISHGAGAEVQKPLATVVIGGLITATMLTLVVLPVLYILFSGKRKQYE